MARADREARQGGRFGSTRPRRRMSSAGPPPAPAASISAAPSGVPMPGGALDPSLSGAADAYLTRPTTATAGPACRAAKAYVDLIQDGQYDKVVNLFARDAVLMEPRHSPPRIGHDQIDDFFRSVIAPGKPQI